MSLPRPPYILASILIASATLNGCGTYVPDKDPLRGNAVDPRTHMSRAGARESNIIASIRCEVGKGLYQSQVLQSAPYLSNWGTTVSLTMTFDEMGNASPGLTYTDPLSAAESFMLGASASASAHSTRAETITFTWDNQDLITEAGANDRANNLQCKSLASGILIDSDLKLDEFIYDKVSIARGGEATTNHLIEPQFSVFQDTLTFVATLGGGVTPSWKLRQVSVNTAGTFLGASRTETNLVLVTLGPLKSKRKSKSGPQLADQPRSEHDSTFTGNAVGTAVMSLSR